MIVRVLHDEGRHAHLTKCLAIEWGKYNIRVNAVAPTFIHTPGTTAALSDPEFRASVIERIAALHRIGEPMDVPAPCLSCFPGCVINNGSDAHRWRLDRHINLAQGQLADVPGITDTCT